MNFDVRQRHRLTVSELREQVEALRTVEATTINPNTREAARMTAASLTAWINYWTWLRAYRAPEVRTARRVRQAWREAA